MSIKSSHASKTSNPQKNQRFNSPKQQTGAVQLGLIEKHHPTLLSSLPDPTVRYLHSLSRRLLTSIRLTELGASAPLTLADIYTGGDLSPTTMEDARIISFARPEFGIDKQKTMHVLKHTPHSVILADVGAGKTTLLNKLAFDIINSKTSDFSGTKRPIPVLVPLHILPQDSLEQFHRFVEEIENYVRKTEGILDFSLLQGDQFVLLLDGFDELRSQHEAVASHIAVLRQRFPKGLLLTSRPSRIPSKLTNFHFYKLNPFTDVNIQNFLTRWFPQRRVPQTQSLSEDC